MAIRDTGFLQKFRSDQRTATGEGQFVDVSMLDAALSFISGQVAEYTVTGHIHRQFGNLSSTGKVTGNRFKTGGG
jgi:crotonobetainyl-CoA:carnitine CoA-transferase CaiB-like acyl-CoA transferase